MRAHRYPTAARCSSLRARAALLALVWVAPGIGAVAHELSHADASGSGAHVERTAADAQPHWLPAHGHGHTHFSSLPDGSVGKAQKLDANALSLAAHHGAAPTPRFGLAPQAAPARAGPSRSAVLGQRAPPIS